MICRGRSARVTLCSCGTLPSLQKERCSRQLPFFGKDLSSPCFRKVQVGRLKGVK